MCPCNIRFKKRCTQRKVCVCVRVYLYVCAPWAWRAPPRARVSARAVRGPGPRARPSPCVSAREPCAVSAVRCVSRLSPRVCRVCVVAAEAVRAL